MANELEAGMETLHQLKSTEPPVWLAPKQELSEVVRAASRHLYSCLKPHTRKSPFDQLLVEGFDAEQIWQQIDLQSQPLISSLRREVKKFGKNPEEISRIKEFLEEGKKNALVEDENGKRMEQDDEDEDDDMDLDDDEEEEEEEEEDRGGKGEVGSEEDGSEMEGEGKGGIEDRFLKIKELQEYLEEDEAIEFGLKKKTKSAENKKEDEEEEEEEEEEDYDDEVDEDEDELGIFDGDDDEDADKLENARYKDFFGSNKKKGSKGKSKFIEGSEEDLSSDDDQDYDKATGNHKKDGLSTHEKELEKLQSKIEQMEKANLDPKVWTMRGEVTAAQRQKNSALEVDLDFEHNVRPAPVITEEVTASLEDMIKNRVVEGRFDDVQKAPTLPIKAPREVKELDETKSKKSLADIYEEEYMKKTNPASAPLSFSDEQKKEATMLFKKLCLKLDALSHFHFTPKPVIEDMSIQTNLPALAMEEIAPVAVSDAAMLAPEEVFAGKGDIKEEVELTKAERKRRRANKKRKFKAEAAKGVAKKTQDNNVLPNQSDGKAA